MKDARGARSRKLLVERCALRLARRGGQRKISAPARDELLALGREYPREESLQSQFQLGSGGAVDVGVQRARQRIAARSDRGAIQTSGRHIRRGSERDHAHARIDECGVGDSESARVVGERFDDLLRAGLRATRTLWGVLGERVLVHAVAVEQDNVAEEAPGAALGVRRI